jgi:hypothetical protein
MVSADLSAVSQAYVTADGWANGVGCYLSWGGDPGNRMYGSSRVVTFWGPGAAAMHLSGAFRAWGDRTLQVRCLAAKADATAIFVDATLTALQVGRIEAGVVNQ